MLTRRQIWFAPILFLIVARPSASGQPESKSVAEFQILDRLIQARARGAKLYNDGDARAAAVLFKKVLGEAYSALADQPDLREAIGQTLQAANVKTEADGQVFLYHRSITKLTKDLQAMDSPTKLIQLAEEALAKSDLDRSAAIYLRVRDKHAIHKGLADEELLVATHRALGNIRSRQRNFPESIRELSTAILLRPKVARTWAYRAKVFARMGEYEKMKADYAEALRHAPTAHEIHDEFAWYLATCPDPLHRDGAAALKLARQACSLSKNKIMWYFDTLAAAHAQLEQFEDAVRVLKTALNASDDLSESQRNSLRYRLAQYEQGQATRSTQPTPLGVDFALHVILPAGAKIRPGSSKSVDGMSGEFTTQPLGKGELTRGVLQGKLLPSEGPEAHRVVQVRLEFSVGDRLEHFDLTYTLKQRQVRWVDAREIIDEWRQTLKSLSLP